MKCRQRGKPSRGAQRIPVRDRIGQHTFKTVIAIDKE